MTRKSLKLIQKLKNKRKITCLTAYTKSVSKIIDNYVDIILIGDSLGTVIYGMKNTQSVTLDQMINHGKTVYNYSKKAFTIIDMPFKSYDTKKNALNNAKKLLKETKCQAVKIEVDKKNVDIVEHLVKNRIKVISHIGVTPQKYKNFNKIKSLGKKSKEQKEFLNLAFRLEEVGSCMIFLECIKEKLAKKISTSIRVPTIGIGASIDCDGQVLVINDILGLEIFLKKPKFIKLYENLNKKIETAVENYCKDVINKKFPRNKNIYK